MPAGGPLVSTIEVLRHMLEGTGKSREEVMSGPNIKDNIELGRATLTDFRRLRAKGGHTALACAL